ncbi:hypothetical protein V5F44_05830 [Xanthobacter sp. V2C-8]|uniref:hypothetical protein n=1 Tax=Xanthobacter albus TaxID=3119929 RepID=UPI0037298BA7
MWSKGHTGISSRGNRRKSPTKQAAARALAGAMARHARAWRLFLGASTPAGGACPAAINSALHAAFTRAFSTGAATGAREKSRELDHLERRP